ncbi:hypothetical protein BVRB_6g147070 [Beta vulgaris subsp. vulgaris]|nr:hypothetical protein BVRB_6g147070 [Beta vulgaris subsp. vulgaris]
METMKLRLRVNFQDRGILSKTQKKNGLKRSWVLLKPQFQTISDVVSYLLHSFDLHHSCPNGIILFMNGFVLPPFESTTIFKDKDRISVKRNGLGLCNSLKASEEARLFVEDAIVEKQPLPSAVRLLANEEFDKETGGYQSEIDEDEDEAEEPVQNAQGGDVVSKKRKASSKIESSKKKRQRQVTPESVQKKDADHREHVKTPQKKRKLANESTHKVAINCTKSPEPTSNTNELEDKKEKTVHASGAPNGERKVCRSTRRKRIQRKWQKVHSAKTNVAEGEKQVPVQDLNKDSGSGKDVVKNIEQLVLEDGDADDDLVPVEIRPGHIRFTPSGKSKDIEDNQEANGWDVQTTQKSSFEDHTTQKHVWDVDKHTPAKETFCWNGITNKRKGQQWGKENQPTSWKESRDYSSHSSSRAARNQPSSSWKGQRDYNTHSSGAWASRKQRPNNTYVDFEKLIPLIDLPKVGDIIAYRLLELSSSWCPQLSSFRVGKISCVHQDSNKIMLVPEPEYPLNLERKAGDDHDDDSGEPPQPSVYNEDGSLEIDFPSLVDVRILKRVDSSQSEATGAPASDGTSVPPNMSKKNNITEDGSKNVVPDTGNQKLRTPGAPANGKKDVWEEISEALSAKKAQLTQEDSWNKKETSAKRSWSRRTLKSSALGPTMALLRAQNGV